MEADLLVLISADFLERRSWELGRAVQRTPTTRQGESADLSAFISTNPTKRVRTFRARLTSLGLRRSDPGYGLRDYMRPSRVVHRVLVTPSGASRASWPMGTALNGRPLASPRAAHLELARTISPSASIVGPSVCMKAAMWIAVVVFPLPPLKLAIRNDHPCSVMTSCHGGGDRLSVQRREVDWQGKRAT